MNTVNTVDESEDFKRSKISPQLKRQGDIRNRFKTDNNFYFHNPFLKKNEKPNYMKNSTSSSQTTTTYDLSLSDDSDDSAEEDNFHHLASFNRNIEHENRNDWIFYMKSSIPNRHFETQSVTNNRIKIRSRNSMIDTNSLNILAQTNTPLKNSLKYPEKYAPIVGNQSPDHEFQSKIFSKDIRFEIFGRRSLNLISEGNELSIVDLDEPYSKSICSKSFYLQSESTRNKRGLFNIENHVSTHDGDQCFSQTLAPFFNIANNYSTEDEGSEQSQISSDVSTETSLTGETPLPATIAADHSEIPTDTLDQATRLSQLYAAVHSTEDTLLVISIMKSLLPQAIIDYRDIDHKSLLHIACERNNTAIAKIFLALGFVLDIIDCNERTCLHLTENEEVVIALCEEGASCDLLDSDGQTPLHVYIQKENKACLSAILKYGANAEALLPPNQWSALHMAANLGNAEMMQILLTQSLTVVDFRRKDIHANTAMHLAAACERECGDPLRAIMLLLNLGAPATSANSRGSTVLHLLCGNRKLTQLSSCEPIVEMLLSLEADPNSKDVDGSTPLTVACLCRGWSICSLLMEAGADLNIPFNMSSPFLASLRSSEGSVAPPSKTQEEMKQFEAIDKWMREADCRPNDLLSVSVRKMLYSRISVPQTKIPLELRDRCMHCALSFEEEKEKKKKAAAMSMTSSFFSSFTSSLSDVVVKFSCCMCGRVLCEACTSFEVNRQMLPNFLLELSTDKTFRVCKLCFSILKEK
eukprot:gene28427-37367_t